MYKVKDHFFKKAKHENYAARSAFKLQEIDQKFKVFRPGDVVLDLGAAPGSWSQYAAKRIGEKGRILGLDLKPVTTKVPQALFLVGDIYEVPWEAMLEKHGICEGFNVVMSDMAPNTTGVKFQDQSRSTELCQKALDLALAHLRTNGCFICKFFHSQDFKALKERIKSAFERFEATRPESTRSNSKEIFLIGIRKK